MFWGHLLERMIVCLSWKDVVLLLRNLKNKPDPRAEAISLVYFILTNMDADS